MRTRIFSGHQTDLTSQRDTPDLLYGYCRLADLFYALFFPLDQLSQASLSLPICYLFRMLRILIVGTMSYIDRAGYSGMSVRRF